MAVDVLRILYLKVKFYMKLRDRQKLKSSIVVSAMDCVFVYSIAKFDRQNDGFLKHVF